MEFPLPACFAELLKARAALRHHYNSILSQHDTQRQLNFTLDGNLVGDIGEAIAVERFGIKLMPKNATAGIDGIAAHDNRTVQVKATGTERGPVFRNISTHADHLLFFKLDFEQGKVIVVYNGPEAPVREELPRDGFKDQRQVSFKKMQQLDLKVKPADRLPLLEYLL